MNLSPPTFIANRVSVIHFIFVLGINTAAMFQECLFVLKTIVWQAIREQPLSLHSTTQEKKMTPPSANRDTISSGIQTASTPNRTEQTPLKELQNDRVTANLSNSGVVSSFGCSNRDNKHFSVLGSKLAHGVAAGASPVSSGFGSLQDEGSHVVLLEQHHHHHNSNNNDNSVGVKNRQKDSEHEEEKQHHHHHHHHHHRKRRRRRKHKKSFSDNSHEEDFSPFSNSLHHLSNRKEPSRHAVTEAWVHTQAQVQNSGETTPGGDLEPSRKNTERHEVNRGSGGSGGNGGRGGGGERAHLSGRENRYPWTEKASKKHGEKQSELRRSREMESRLSRDVHLLDLQVQEEHLV